MSINSAMLAGVAALRANSSALAAISNNIANINTTSYKREVTNFADIVTSASSRKSYTAGGVSANTSQKVSAVGSLESTTSTLDVGIDGQGFFVATEKSNPLTADPRVFTRAGSLSKDMDGFLKNADGFFVQGWLVDADGVVTTDPSDLSRLAPINIANVGGTAEATTRASIVANLDSEQTLSSAVDPVLTYDPTAAATAMSTYDSATGTGTKPDFEISIPVSDSKGGQRNLTLSVLRSATSNTWYAELWSADIDDGNGTGQLATGNLVFNSDGTVDTTNSTLLTALSGSSTINASGSGTTPNWDDLLGVAAQSININLDGITQYASVSATSQVTANGTAFGNVKSVEIGKDGMVTAIFDNGVQRNIAQLALATFTNPDGLKGLSNNAYQVTTESGTYNLKIPGTGGSGKLVTSTLEASTVDLSAEFTGLITTQRAYSAASKIITTADDMIQELLNIKR